MTGKVTPTGPRRGGSDAQASRAVPRPLALVTPGRPGGVVAARARARSRMRQSRSPRTNFRRARSSVCSDDQCSENARGRVGSATSRSSRCDRTARTAGDGPTSPPDGTTSTRRNPRPTAGPPGPCRGRRSCPTSRPIGRTATGPWALCGREDPAGLHARVIGAPPRHRAPGEPAVVWIACIHALTPFHHSVVSAWLRCRSRSRIGGPIAPGHCPGSDPGDTAGAPVAIYLGGPAWQPGTSTGANVRSVVPLSSRLEERRS